MRGYLIAVMPRIGRLIGCATFVSLLVGPALAAASTDAGLERNKTTAIAFFKYEDKLDLDGLRSIIREDYIQHNLGVEDRREPLLKLFASWKSQPPRPAHEMIRVLAEGDLVWIYARQNSTNGLRARVDMFRVEDGKLAEHWEIGEIPLAKRSNANDNFAVGRGLQDASKQPVRVGYPISVQRKAANEAVVREFYNAFEDRDGDRLRKIMRLDYIQHNANVDDGREGLLGRVESWKRESRPKDPPNELIRMIAEGDYVWVFVRDQGGKHAQLNQFRIEGGQLAEHWGLYQDVPTHRVHTNDFFGMGRGSAIDFSR